MKRLFPVVAVVCCAVAGLTTPVGAYDMPALGIDAARAIAKFMEVADAHLADGSNR
jgi:hypothetical protein